MRGSLQALLIALLIVMISLHGERPASGLMSLEDPPETTAPASTTGNPFGGSANSLIADEVVESGAANEIGDPQFVAENDGTKDHDQVPVASSSPPCAEQASSSDGLGNVAFWCAAHFICGGERVDEVFTGERSGTSAAGAYAEYLGEMVGLVGGDAPTDFNVNADSVNDLLIDQGLEDPPDDAALPVFYYCRRDDTDAIALFPTADPPVAADLSPRFAWDTTYAAEYDLDGARDRLLDELKVRLALYKPVPETIPPLDTEHTFVHFPTWLWLTNPIEGEEVWSESDLSTIHIDIRARLVRVDWEFKDPAINDEILIECAPDDMKAYEQHMHPWDDRPECIVRFPKLGTYELSATMIYEIEERIMFRPSSLVPFVPAPFTPHPTEPNPELTTVIGEYGVHQIVALSVYGDPPEPGN